jgi:exosortase/archaeosortase family protein
MSGGGLFFVDNQCTGLASGIVLASVVLALRKPDWKRKIAMIAGGALALFVLNIPRLLVVLWTAQAFGVEAARTVHVATWFLTTVFILGVWYLVTTQFGAKTRLEELL